MGFERVIDRDLIASIIRRFGEPTPPREEPKPAVHPAAARFQAACDAADPEFVSHMWEKFDHAEDVLLRPPEQPEPDPATTADRWPTSEIGDITYERSPETLYCLQEHAPPAILRDLHRPVSHFVPRMQPTIINSDPLSERARARVAEAISATYSIRLGAVETAWQVGLEALAELRSILDAPWEDSKPENPTVSSRIPTENDLRWFGGGGD